MGGRHCECGWRCRGDSELYKISARSLCVRLCFDFDRARSFAVTVAWSSGSQKWNRLDYLSNVLATSSTRSCGNHALEETDGMRDERSNPLRLTRPLRCGCKPRVQRAGSLSFCLGDFTRRVMGKTFNRRWTQMDADVFICPSAVILPGAAAWSGNRRSIPSP